MFRWTADPLPAYDSRCALLGLESIEDWRMIACAFLIRDLLCGRIYSPHLVTKLRFEQRPYATDVMLNWFRSSIAQFIEKHGKFAVE
jgi:hypothetical protein